MSRTVVVWTIAALAGCTGSSPDILSSRISSESPQKKVREVSIDLKVIAPDTFQPLINQRTVIAEPLTVVHRTRFQAKYLLDGTEVVRIVDNCEDLGGISSQPLRCAEVVQKENVYGAVESTVITDANGSAKMLLGNSSYRLTVESVATQEDKACHWSGSVLVESLDTLVELPLAVYCEAE